MSVGLETNQQDQDLKASNGRLTIVTNGYISKSRDHYQERNELGQLR